MTKNKIKNAIVFAIIIVLTFSSLNINISGKEIIPTNENYEFSQEIKIPIDTNNENSIFHPIDLKIYFNNPCWANDEKIHSIRIFCENGQRIEELESQIYDLEFQRKNIVKSCSIVFLIPDFADGDEKYYVYYNSKETEEPNYIAHLDFEDTHYFFEPIPGQIIDFDYYKITDDESINYAIIQKGELLGNPVAFAIAKFKAGTKKVETNKIDQLGIFDMRYGINKYPEYTGSSWANKVNKNVIASGNLMIRIKIEGVSPSGVVKTRNIYTYYHCPTDRKMIYINAEHDILKTQNIENPVAVDGTYAGIVTIKSRSASIEKMNVGEVLPNLKIFGEDENIKEFELPKDPNSIKTEYILTTKDDYDLGKKAWVCLTDSENEKAHGLIFDSIEKISEEDDGIQAKAFVIQNVKLPGLEADTGSLICTKNTYEAGGTQNTVLKQGFNAKYNVKFITVEKNGYNSIDSESEIFKDFIKEVPFSEKDENITDEEQLKYSLTTYVHNAFSFPLGSLLSAAVGKKFSYIYAELYKNDSIKSSGSVGRISLSTVDFNLEGMNIIEKLRFALNIFDWKNISFFKKIVFPDLLPGKYIIKIYRENPFLSSKREFIGFKIINIKKDEKTHIFCKKEAKINVKISNQNNENIEDAEILLLNDDQIIDSRISDKNESIYLFSPLYNKENFVLRLLYNGFLIGEEDIDFSFVNRFKEINKEFFFDIFSLDLIIKDSWEMNPEIELNPVLSSNEMYKETQILPKKISSSRFTFSKLSKANYFIKIKYKTFEVLKELKINDDKEIELVFPAEFSLLTNIYDSYGNLIDKGRIVINRNGKEISKENEGKTQFELPPGSYNIKVFLGQDKISEEDFFLQSGKELNIVSSKKSDFNQVIFFLGLIFLIFSSLYLIFKRNPKIAIKLIIISLLLISLVSPWWSLSGETDFIKTNTKSYLIPSKIVSLTSSGDIIGGEINQVPEEVNIALMAISILIAFCIFLILFSLFLNNNHKKTMSVINLSVFVLLIVCIMLFYYLLLQLTQVSVGSFIGGGEIDISVPGIVDSKMIFCNWGPDIGFYLTLFSVILFFGYKILKKVKISAPIGIRTRV